MSLRHLRDAIDRGELERGDAVAASLELIDGVNLRLNAFSEVRPQAMDEITEGPLSGVPIGVKDLLVDRDRPPGAGSKVHGEWLSGTAESVRRLRAAGAAIVGYTNLHEWGVGTSSAITATGPIVNPRARDRIAGGSSGGSAAAVAAGMVTAAIGTDAGGSIRIPAACCGITGLKPTHGRVPTDGFTGHGGGIDHIGPMGRSVGDVRALFEVLVGSPALPVDVAQVRIGIAREHFFDSVEADVETALSRAVSELEGIVEEIEDVVVEGAAEARRAIPIFLLSPLIPHLEPALTERSDDFQPETREILLRARSIDDTARERASQIRAQVIAGWEKVFRKVDVVLTPTIPCRPPSISDPDIDLSSSPRSADRAFVPLNAPMNVAGVPSLSMPCGELADGTTVNCTLTAMRDNDDVVLAVAEALEATLDRAYANKISHID